MEAVSGCRWLPGVPGAKRGAPTGSTTGMLATSPSTRYLAWSSTTMSSESPPSGQADTRARSALFRSKRSGLFSDPSQDFRALFCRIVVGGRVKAVERGAGLGGDGQWPPACFVCLLAVFLVGIGECGLVRMSASRSTSRATRSRLGTARRRFSWSPLSSRTEGERVVPSGCPKSFVLFHAQLGSLVVVTMSGQAMTWQATAQTQDDLPAIDNHMVWSIVTGRPMTGLSVVDRANVTSSQEQARRVHTDSIWYGRLGYGGVFGDSTYGAPALGFGYRAELDSFAIDLAFLNHQFSSPGSYSSPRASAFSVVEVVGAPVPESRVESLRVLRRRFELRAPQHQSRELFATRLIRPEATATELERRAACRES